MRGGTLGYKFRRQHGMGKYVVDFYCPARKLIIEIDGSQHGDQKAESYDNERTIYLESLGYRVLRFWNNEINTNLEGILLKIVEALDANTSSPSIPLLN